MLLSAQIQLRQILMEVHAVNDLGEAYSAFLFFRIIVWNFGSFHF